MPRRWEETATVLASKPHPSSTIATSNEVAERKNLIVTVLAPECLATLVRASWTMRYKPIWTADERLLESNAWSLRSTTMSWVFTYSETYRVSATPRPWSSSTVG